jgi:integrase|tara:strand:- start:405 stop:1388 length:984 start_codon:yes stop_codon:yes gene_type:complete
MASYRKRNGKWYVEIKRKGLGNVYKTFINKEDAASWAKDTERQLEQGTYQTVHQGNVITLKELLTDYRDNVVTKKKSNEPETYKINKLIKHSICRKVLTRISVIDVRNLRDEISEHVAAATVNKYIGIISASLNYAIKQLGISLPLNVCKNVPRLKEIEFDETRVDEAMEQRLLEAAKLSRLIYLRAIIVVALDCGMRRGEIFKLTSNDVDLVLGTAKLNDTKNGTSRTVGLSPRAIELIRQLPIGIDKKIFPIKSVNQFRFYWKQCKERAKVNIRFHTLRHEFASRLFERGWDIAEVAAQGGWKDWKVLKRYTKISGAHLSKRLRS